MASEKFTKSVSFKTTDDEKGNVEAVFSVFNNLDSDGDVVLPGAIKSGFKDDQVPMVFAHKWDQPIGKGKIVQEDDKAVFKGKFFMGTEAGKEAYNLAKEMGDLQEWSFGFRINDYEVAEFQKDGESVGDVRYLKDLEVYEVSPVLVGANRQTYTLAIKTGEEAIYESSSEEKAANDEDIFDNEEDAKKRGKELGCEGSHRVRSPDGTYHIPCRSHSIYMRITGQNKAGDYGDDAKAESDVDTIPTDEMAKEAARGLEMRREFGRGGTQIGVARANQLVAKERLSPRTVRRMHSFFSRHEVDKRAEGFRQGEDGYPSAGKIAWLLWGGDAGQRWARRKVRELERAEGKAIEDEMVMFGCCDDCEPLLWGEAKAEVSAKVKKALAEKVKDHNEKHGDKKGKRVTSRMLEAVFKRGVGAYRTNPESVRPSVSGSDQWAYARVNAFLFAVRTGRFKSGKFDLDLLPRDHPLSSKK